MKKALVTGGTGFVGKHLCALLPDVNVLTRSPESAPPELAHASCFRWSPEDEPPPRESLHGCDAVFHLAGESVAKGRWTSKKKARIRSSRILGTKNLVAGLEALPRPPSVLVCASAVGYYGSRGDEVLHEGSEPGTGFLADVCREWEAAAYEAKSLGVRVVTVRIGLVLGRGGGALSRLLPVFKLGAGGFLGTGEQWMAWIHVADLARFMVFTAEHPRLEGPANGVAPNPVTNRGFTKALGRVVRRPTVIPTPEFALRFALGEFSEVLLGSQRVVPRAAMDAKFAFRFRNVALALDAICNPRPDDEEAKPIAQ